jgi:hypothetical protein
VLSLGLVFAFARLLRSRTLSNAASELRAALGRRPGVPHFESVELGEDAADDAVALLREARHLHSGKVLQDALGTQGGKFVGIARSLVVDHDPKTFLRQLIEQHRVVKGGEAWVRLVGDRVEIIAKTKNLELHPAPRTYRLDAFMQFLIDMRRLR